MPRLVLQESSIHPAIRDVVAAHHRSVIQEVTDAMSRHPVVVVGMAMNPFVKKARKALVHAGVACHYIEYGGYLDNWRKRNVLKMWSGWPTFPMVFVRGVLIGGADELTALLGSGELKDLASQQGPR